MVFRNGGIVKWKKKWFYQDSDIEIVSMYKYLGVYLHQNLYEPKQKNYLPCKRIRQLQASLDLKKKTIWFLSSAWCFFWFNGKTHRNIRCWNIWV